MNFAVVTLMSTILACDSIDDVTRARAERLRNKAMIGASTIDSIFGRK